jgi:hypothetical protein
MAAPCVDSEGLPCYNPGVPAHRRCGHLCVSRGQECQRSASWSVRAAKSSKKRSKLRRSASFRPDRSRVILICRCGRSRLRAIRNGGAFAPKSRRSPRRSRIQRCAKSLAFGSLTARKSRPIYRVSAIISRNIRWFSSAAGGSKIYPASAITSFVGRSTPPALRIANKAGRNTAPSAMRRSKVLGSTYAA